MPVHLALRVTGAAAYQLLLFSYESGDIIPPLKSVAGGALYIMVLVVVRAALRKAASWSDSMTQHRNFELAGRNGKSLGPTSKIS